MSFAFWCTGGWSERGGKTPFSGSLTHIHWSTGRFTTRRNSSQCWCISVFSRSRIWIAERVLVTIFRRQGMEAWKSMINDVGIEKMRNHFIVCGYGQVGRTVVDQLKRLEIPFVLIETNDGLYRELLNDGVLVIQGDAKRHDILQTAGIHRARGICIVIDNDADNLYITVTARSMNSELKIITRAGQQRYAQAIRSSGADEVILPEYEGGLIDGPRDRALLSGP